MRSQTTDRLSPGFPTSPRPRLPGRSDKLRKLTRIDSKPVNHESHPGDEGQPGGKTPAFPPSIGGLRVLRGPVRLSASSPAEQRFVGPDEGEALVAAGRHKAGGVFARELERRAARLEQIRQTDFFDSPRGHDAQMRLDQARNPPAGKQKAPPVLSAKKFLGRIWLTRPRPEIDRVGSAWLIRRFIDPRARFVFSNRPADHPGALPFDLPGAEFSHQGDDCTFETLVRRFGLDDPAVHRLGSCKRGCGC